MSRARNAFYIVGNAGIMQTQSDLWKKVITTLQLNNNIGPALKLCCQNHPETFTMVSDGFDIRTKAKDGGCHLLCDYRLTCGHSCKKFCHPGGHDRYVCYETCHKKFACGHYCGKMCHEECGVCKQFVAVTLEACGHEMMVQCYESKAHVICEHECPRILPCGHQCLSVCGKGCPTKCKTQVEIELPCKHKQSVDCCLVNNLSAIECNSPCPATLECGHKCSGSCSKCKNGHIKCTRPCQRTLVCNHTCSNTCEKSCAPCGEKCQVQCSHSRCQRKCSAICVPCMQPCDWKCYHHKCTKLCHEGCNRPRCNQPCRRLKRCGHPCIGLCGEWCPKLCRICDADSKWVDIHTLDSLKEADKSTR